MADIASDPMWADYCEVSKRSVFRWRNYLIYALDRIAYLETTLTKPETKE